jgi:hypothetical protein
VAITCAAQPGVSIVGIEFTEHRDVAIAFIIAALGQGVYICIINGAPKELNLWLSHVFITGWRTDSF